MALARPNSHYGLASPSRGCYVGTPTSSNRAQRRWGGATGGGSPAGDGGRGRRGEQEGSQEDTLGKASGGMAHREALGRWRSSRRRCSGRPVVNPEVPAAQI
jgi:hypothetical protein